MTVWTWFYWLTIWIMHQMTKNYVLNNESASRTEILINLYILYFFIP